MVRFHRRAIIHEALSTRIFMAFYNPKSAAPLNP
jgi:hypothetical protein